MEAADRRFLKLVLAPFTGCLLLLATSSLDAAAAAAAALTLRAPLDHQVIQRQSEGKGTIPVSADGVPAGVSVEARIVIDGKPGNWQAVAVQGADKLFNGTIEAPAGGWYRCEVRAREGEKIVGEAAVEHVGIGEVFVVAGQSNSANHGEEKQQTKTGRVATFDGSQWQLCNDPQPGASGGGGSFMPPLGDLIVKKFDVPVGFVACGMGGTSVREWLPKGATFPNPPTVESQVKKLPGGEWESKGDAYQRFVDRMTLMGRNGFRAVLWHQGESDANQADTSRTLDGKLYREYLEQIIRGSRHDIGWDAPWFVAQATYHVPGDESSADIRAAQASVWKDGVALEGPDTDALKGDLREAGGKGVHFSGPGIREHAAKWYEKVTPWLEGQLK